MATYTFSAQYTLQAYDFTTRRLIAVVAQVTGGKFPNNSTSCVITVKSGVISKRSFYTAITPDGKKMFGLFTTDAFASMPAPQTITAGYANSVVAAQGGMDIMAIIEPLPAHLAALSHPDGDNTWFSPYA